MTGAGILLTLVMGAIVLFLVLKASPALGHDGIRLITGTTWDPVHGKFGALPFIVGTIMTTAVALVFAVPIGLGAAIYLATYASPRVKRIISPLVELLAAVPSVVYGLWGLLVLAPVMSRTIEPAMLRWLSFLPFVSNGVPYGVGFMLAGFVLFIMILPTMAALSRDVIAAVPVEQLDGARAIGATHWQATRRVVLPAARSGIVGAGVLAAGRALGETMAVTMVIGNTNAIPHSLLDPAQTMSSLVANEFAEASAPYHLSSLIAVVLLLLLLTMAVNATARLLVRSVSTSPSEVEVA
ncbi:MAG: phosphate ABC transporter permease subunit PstC [Actinomycetota bacterium]